MVLSHLNNYMFTENIIHGYILQEPSKIYPTSIIIPKSITIKDILKKEKERVTSSIRDIR